MFLSPVRHNAQYSPSPPAYPVDVPWDLSQRDGLIQNSFAHTRFESAFCDNIHVLTEQILQIHESSSQVQETSTWFQIYQEVDSAWCVSFAARPRPKHTHIVRAVLSGNLQNRLVLLF